MYHVNPQGDEYEKNIMAFKRQDVLTRTEYQEAEYQIQLAIAVAFGQDKVTDELKMEWFASNEDSLDWTKAKEPTYAQAQILSLHRLRTTDTTNIPVEADATCSQRQIVAVLTGSLQTAMTCNIITDNSRIQDAYGMVAHEMSVLSGLKFNRSQIKASDMISGYGAGEKRVTQQLQEDLLHHYYDGVAKIFFDASKVVDPMATKIKETFQSLWDDTRTEWTWTLPDNFKVTYRTQEARQITVNPFGQGEITVIAHMIVPTSKNTGLGVNIIHSVDAYVCRQMVERCPFDIITIHDGYRCLPHNVPFMRKVYNQIMAEITDSTLLEDIIFELSGLEFRLKKEFSGSHVMNSEYAIS
jgi:DNA-directed RNA polymerase